jgi:putative membrane protein
MIKFILDILRGVVIGVANVIPGVSGGTMMVSMGIYDDIISSINNLFKNFKKSLLTLLPYGIGMVAGIVGFAFAIEWLFGKFPIPTALLFIGLIFGGIPMLWKKVKGKTDAGAVILFILFFALIIGLEILGQRTGIERELNLTPVGIIISVIVGCIAAATMIIPGVSGSMVMMILGYYNSIIGTVTGLITALKETDFKSFFGLLGALIPFIIGVVIGLFGVAKLIRYLLDKHESKTYAAILGLIAASPYPVYVHSGATSISTAAVLFGILTFAVGFVAALKLGKE